MKIELTTITPEVAARMLENNPSNRNIKRDHVAAIARDMTAGRWQINGDAIRLNGDGSLIDGQHRLSACVLSGVPFQTVVITGLSHDVRATIDGGAKRRHGDRLAMLGVHNANTVSAAARLVAGIATGQGRRISMTSQELDAVLAANTGIHTSVNFAGKAFQGMGSVLSAIHYIGTATGNADKADRYVAVFRDGIPSYQGCAAHALRERIIKHDTAPSKYNSDQLLAAACGTWRHFVTNTPVRQIKIVDDIKIPGWTREKAGF